MNDQDHKNGQSHRNGKSLFRRLTLMVSPGGNLNIGDIQLHIKRDFADTYPSFFISGEQVELILKNTPSVFPEDIKKMERTYERLKNEQKKIFQEITKKGMIKGNQTSPCPIPVIKHVIKIGLAMEESGGHLPK